MNLLPWLLVGHLVGDFLLQTRWMALEKNKNHLPLFIHSLVYSFSIGMFGYLGGGIKPETLLIIFLSHAFLDQRSFVRWWAEKITKSADIPWLVLMIDQTWHIVILALVSFLNSP